MIPRAVQMASAISTLIGPEYEASLGNVIGPVCRKGWSNNYSEWFLNGPNTLGLPTMFSYTVHHWEEGQPFWAQRPIKKFDSPFGAVMYPVADSPIAPFLSNLNEGYGG